MERGVLFAAIAHEEHAMRGAPLPVGVFGPWQTEYLIAMARYPLS